MTAPEPAYEGRTIAIGYLRDTGYRYFRLSGGGVYLEHEFLPRRVFPTPESFHQFLESVSQSLAAPPTCSQCEQSLTGKQVMYCSKACAARAHRKRRRCPRPN